MWAMSDRGIPRSYPDDGRFGIHLPSDQCKGKATFVRFTGNRWQVKPLQARVWDESQN